jgi:hypothetical protein
MKYILIFFPLLICNLSTLFSQPSIQWQRALGSSGCDESTSIKQTQDGGYIISGNAGINSGDVSGGHGNMDYWIVKLSSIGSIEWEKSLGGTNYDYATCVQQTTDEGFIVTGMTTSNDGDVNGNHGDFDVWVVKLDSVGAIQWSKCYGGSDTDRVQSIQQTYDGGFILAGFSNSSDGDLTTNQGYTDYWIFRLDSIGNIIWQNSFGGSALDNAWSVQQTTDSGFIVAGISSSMDGDVIGNHGWNFDYWIVKLNSTGDSILWQKCLGGSSDDILYSIQKCIDKGFIIAGYTSSTDGDVTGNHDLSGSTSDYWIVKLDSIGNIQWSKCLGGTGNEIATDVQQTIDSGFIVAGAAMSHDGDVTGCIDQDYWIVKLNSTGSISWQYCYGGTLAEITNTIQQTFDGGFIVGGITFSNDSDVTGNHGCNDIWIIKLDSSNAVNVLDFTQSKINFNVNPNPFTIETKISFHFPLSSKITVEIRDIQGRLIKILFTNHQNDVVWDATNSSGNKVEFGVYLITLTSDFYTETKKVIFASN